MDGGWNAKCWNSWELRLCAKPMSAVRKPYDTKGVRIIVIPKRSNILHVIHCALPVLGTCRGFPHPETESKSVFSQDNPELTSTNFYTPPTPKSGLRALLAPKRLHPFFSMVARCLLASCPDQFREVQTNPVQKAISGQL